MKSNPHHFRQCDITVLLRTHSVALPSEWMNERMKEKMLEISLYITCIQFIQCIRCTHNRYTYKNIIMDLDTEWFKFNQYGFFLSLSCLSHYFSCFSFRSSKKCAARSHRKKYINIIPCVDIYWNKHTTKGTQPSWKDLLFYVEFTQLWTVQFFRIFS